MPVITVFRLHCFLRASVHLAALGALVSISGCAAYPAGGYGNLPYYGPGYAYAPGFGYSDFGVGLGFGPEPHFHHFDHDFNHRHFDHDFDDRFHRFHGQAMTGEPRHPGSFQRPSGESHGPELHPGFRSGRGMEGEFHARAANPAPPPHPGGGHSNFNR